MTQPGHVAPASPGWWVRTNRIGTNANGYDWAVSATGGRASVGPGAGAYDWAGTAVGIKPAVVLDAVGAGYTALMNNSTGAFNITVAANSRVLLGVCFNTDAAPSAVTCGGTAMTLLGSVLPNNTSPTGRVRLYGLDVASAGTKSVSLTQPGLTYTVMNAVSYLNVGTVSTPGTAFGTTALSQGSGTVTTGQMTVQVFGVTDQVGTGPTSITSASGGTNRYAADAALGSSMVIRDAATTTTFTGTTVSPFVWGGLNVILSP